MQMKNANFIQLHIEKVILAIAALICVVVLWMFVLSDYKVNLQGDDVSVSKVPDHVDKIRKHLDQQLDREIDVPVIEVGNWAEDFRVRRNFAGLLVESFDPLGPPGLSEQHVAPPTRTVSRYAVTYPPAPTDLVASANHTVLMEQDDLVKVLVQQASFDEEGAGSMRQARSAAKDYARIVGESGPRDMQYVTVMAKFDFDEYVKLLQEDQDDSRIPEGWWRRRLLLTDVALERQMKDPATGQWPDDDTFELITTLPGNASFRDQHESEAEWDLFEVRQLIEDIRLAQDLIARPPFAPTTIPWLPPDEQQEIKLTKKQERELYIINQRLDRYRNQLRQLIQRLQKQKERDVDGMDAGMGHGPRGFDGIGVGERRGQRQKSERQMERERKKEEKKRERERKKRERRGGTTSEVTVRRPESSRATLQERLGEIQAKMQADEYKKDILLGRIQPVEDEEGKKKPDATSRRGRVPRFPQVREQFMLDPMMGRGMGREMRGGRSGMGIPGMGMRMPGMMGEMFPQGFQHRRLMPRRRGQIAEAEPQKIPIWSHDITINPGMTYRYRLRVRLMNPLFQQDSLAPDQRQLGQELALLSNATPWSEEIHIDPKLQFFVVQADRVNKRATIEVYCIHDGIRRLETFTITPCDRIGGMVEMEYMGVMQEVDMQADGVAVDVAVRDPQNKQSGGIRSVLIYYDQARNRLSERVVEHDRADSKRIHLNNEATAESELLAEGLAQMPRLQR